MQHYMYYRYSSVCMNCSKIHDSVIPNCVSLGDYTKDVWMVGCYTPPPPQPQTEAATPTHANVVHWEFPPAANE